MKISIALSLLIALIAATLGWNGHQKLSQAKEARHQLAMRASALGLNIDASNPAAAAIRLKHHQREDRDAEARRTAAEFIAFGKEIEAIEAKGEQPDQTLRKNILGLIDRISSLDSAQMKILIAEFRSATDINEETRQGLISFTLFTLASDHPQTALALFTEASDLFAENRMAEQVISTSLAKWAQKDPLGALEWVRKNGEKYPDQVNYNTKLGLILGAAVNDPRTAFKLIGDLGMTDKESSEMIQQIAQNSKTGPERDKTLAAMRDYLKTIPDEKQRAEASHAAVRQLARSAASEGFESGSKWIAAANLSPQELEGITSGVFAYDIRSQDTGKWVEWMGETLPEGKSDQSVKNMVSNWTNNDHQAAGKWLAEAPEGPTKNLAVRTFAETVSRYEPESAAAWAMTLPAGPDRDKTLKQIYHNWPKPDDTAKAAAAAFARQHGIQP